MPSLLCQRLVLAAQAVLLVRGQTCYYPDGNLDDGLAPCNAGADVSSCCGRQDICLDNGYCIVQTENYGNRLSRAGCTDGTWKSSACPSYCSDVNPSGGVTLYLANDFAIGQFCCSEYFNQTSGFCSNLTLGSYDPFPLVTGHVIFNKSDASTSPNTTTAGSGSITNGSQATVTVTAVPALASSNHDTAVGAGVGVPLGLALLTALGFLWRFSQERKRPEQQLQGQTHGQAWSNQWDGQQAGDKVPRELGAEHPLIELSGDRAPNELDGRRIK